MELYKTENTNKNKGLVNETKSVLVDWENKIEYMSEYEIKNESLYDIVNTVKDILYFNNQHQEG